MKLKFLSIFASAAMMAGLVACDNYVPVVVTDGQGQLKTESISVEVSNAEKIVSDAQGATGRKGAPRSRATIDISDFIVTVTDVNGRQVEQWRYADMPELPVFDAGSYTVTVTSGEEPTQAVWDTPYFKGSQNFVIKANEVTMVDPIVCTLANIKVTVKFTDKLVNASAGDLKVIVRTEGANSMTFTPAETRSAYYPATEGLITLSSAFSGTVNGGQEQFTKAIQNVEAGQHRIITYDLSTNPALPPEETGTIDIEGSAINVSTNVEEEDLTVDIPYEDEILDPSDRPGQETGGGDDPNPPTPGDDPVTFSSSLGDLDKVYDIDEFQANGWTADLTIKSTEGLQKVMIKIDSRCLPPSELEGIGLREEFDLVHPEDLAGALNGLGFATINEGDKEASFNVTTFIGMLGGLTPSDGVYPVQSNFIITVTDVKGNTATTSMKFVKKSA